MCTSGSADLVNGLAFLECFSSLLTAQGALQHSSHSPIHTHIHTLTACNVPTAHQEQSRVRNLAQGHFNMQLGEPGIPTTSSPPRLLDDPLCSLSHSRQSECAECTFEHLQHVTYNGDNVHSYS